MSKEPEIQAAADQIAESDRDSVWSALLATAVVRFRMNGRTSPPVRAMCDTGAQSNMIAAPIIQQWQWPTQQCNVRFSGINGTCSKPYTRKLTCELLSRFNDEPLAVIEVVVVPAEVLEMWLPSSPVPEHLIPKHIQVDLADQRAHIPAPIDVLLGAGVWANAIKDGSFLNKFGIAFQPSHLGWLMFGGGVRIQKELAMTMAVSHNNEGNEQLDRLLRRLWELDEVSVVRVRTSEQELCEDYFARTHERTIDGRYQVGIPMRSDIKELGSSRGVALNRFYQLERRFQRDPELKQKYFCAIEELLRDDQMRLVDREPNDWCYHIPHHPVLKKFRVVFDASCRTDKGISLNEAQLIGEKLQDDLFNVIMRFRCNLVAVTADIRKMYLQVKIHPSQWDLQRIFWRPTPQEKVQEYWLTGVTFGMASAPHCAVRAMIQGARDLQAQYPSGASAVERNFYMDDCLTGAQNDIEAKQLCHEMDALLRACGFILDKWRSNRLGVVPGSDQQELSDEALELNELNDTTVLGLRWLPKSDVLMFTFEPPAALSARETTKRKLLSHLAQIFDPNGYIGPVVVQAKILMQKLWRLKTGWDVLVPDEIYREWQLFQQQLPLVTEFRLPRWLGISDERNVSLHGFADASEQAYGAVLYARIETIDRVECILIAAKSRVAPIKTLTVPRLELCAAQLLSELLRSFQQATGLLHLKTTLWSDSQIVLSWLIKDAASLKVFVNNRVQKINRLTAGVDWKHVPSADNPADLLSRGMTAAELQHSAFWWHGPSWLTHTRVYWPNACPKWSERMEDTLRGEMKADGLIENAKIRTTRNVLLLKSLTLRGFDLLSRASDAHALCRLTAWILRFMFNARQRGERVIHRTEGPLTNEEVQRALEFWIRQEQRIYYEEEIKAIQNPESGGITKASAIFKLDPKMDSATGILRVGGRLERAVLPFEQAHPALLPDISPLAKLLVRQAHIRTLHGGQRQMTAVLRQKFWITNLRSLIRSNNSRCVKCVRQRKENLQQIMGELPSDRVRPCRAFKHTGVDYAGPFLLRRHKGRCVTFDKKWVAVFVCMVTKAVHLELVEDLSSAEFIQAFLRFTSLRGNCSRLWSDNGKNFVGAEKELAKMLRSWKNVDLEGALLKYGTEFRFITPYAPHQGGLWEAAVKSMKYHLRRVIGPHKMSSSAFQTVLAQTSAIMNSRPLSALSDDPEDLEFLTPAHLMNGEPIALPFGWNVQDVPDNKLKHAQRIQKMTQVFWKAWTRSYLHQYQQRPKWNKAQTNLKVGDLVIMCEENTPPTFWKLARVVEVFPGTDGRVRNVCVEAKNDHSKSGKSRYKRPVQKLCLLPMDIEADTSTGQCVQTDTTSQNTGEIGNTASENEVEADGSTAEIENTASVQRQRRAVKKPQRYR